MVNAEKGGVSRCLTDEMHGRFGSRRLFCVSTRFGVLWIYAFLRTRSGLHVQILRHLLLLPHAACILSNDKQYP